jgi:hypothetical protein
MYLLARIARTLSPHWKRSLAAAVGVVVLLVLATGVSGEASDDYSLPVAESQQAIDLFQAHVIGKMLGLGLGLAILIDVLIARMVVAPAVVTLLGDRAWLHRTGDAMRAGTADNTARIVRPWWSAHRW